MKIIDNKGKLFGLINIIDLTVLLILVLLVGFGVSKTLNTNTTIVNKTQKVQYKIEINRVRDITVDAIEVGETLKEFKKNIVIGKIVSKDVENAIDIVKTSDGKIVEAEIPNKYKITLTIECDANVTNTLISTNGEELLVGKSLFIRGSKFFTSGVMVGVEQ